MTDKERLLALLKDFGVEPRISEDGCGVRLLQGHGGVDGHYAFFCDFDFDKDGKFLQVGVWE